MKIVKSKSFELIEEFLKINFSSPTHWPKWNTVISNHFETEFFYFCAYDKDELIGICPVHLQRNGRLNYLRSGQFKFIPNGGWICKRPCVITDQMIPIGMFSSFNSNALPDVPQFNVEYSKNIHSNNALTLLVDLSESLDNIWKSFLDSKRRNMIRKAEKSNITIEIDDKTDLSLFYHHYNSANNRYNIESLTYKVIQKLFSQNDSYMNFEILWAKQNGEILNGIVIAYDKDYAIYLFGFSDSNVPNLGQGEILQWKAIQRMKSYGCSFYDLCYIEKERLPSIYKFKKGFSKIEVEIPILQKKNISFKIMNKITNSLKQ